MSDKFDKDQPPPKGSGDKPPNPEQPEDDETFDWERDETQQPAQKPGRLGFTGELPWLQRLGEQSKEPVERADDELFEWMRQQAEQQAEQPEEDEGTPAWVTEADEPPEDVPAPELPAWLLEERQTPPAQSQDEPPITEGGALSESFLAQADKLADEAAAELSYDQWIAEQERLRRGPNLEEETPDLSGMEGRRAPPGTGELPDWYLGLEEIDTSDAPEWLQGETQPPGSAGPMTETPSWLADLEAPDASQQPPEGAFDDDFFAALGKSAQPEEEAPPLQDATQQSDEESLEELYAALGASMEQPEDDGEAAWLAEEEAELSALPEASGELPDDMASLYAALEGIRQSEAPPAEEDIESFKRSWLGDEQEPEESEAEAVPLDDDFLRSLGLDKIKPGRAGTAQQPEEPPDMSWLEEPAAPAPSPAAPGDDFLAGLGIEEPPEASAPGRDPFAFEPSDREPDWVGAIGEADAYDEDEEEAEAPLLPADDDWLADLTPAKTEPPAEPDTQYLEQFLASLEKEGAELPETGDLTSPVEEDLESLFANPAYSDFTRERTPAGQGSEALPDFLRDLEANVGDVSAGSLVRQRKDRPLDKLPERLQKLHERGEKLPQTPPGLIASDPIASVLPGIRDTLAPAPIKPGLPGIAGAVTLSDDQRSRVNLLRTLLAQEEGTPEPALASAIDATYDAEDLSSLFMLDEDEAPKPKTVLPPALVPQKQRRKRRLRLDRILIAAVLAGAMIAPFYVRDLRLGGLPPAAFPGGSAGLTAASRIDALQSGDLALVAVEYGPGAAAELDPLTDALVRHLLLRGVRPVLVSGNAVGLLHVENLVNAINEDAAFLRRAGLDEGLRANRDYYAARYLTGGAAGLRALSENPAPLFVYDIRGRITRLNVTSLRDFGILILVAERADDVRAYAEQVVPLAGAPFVVATGYSAAPFVQPYTTGRYAETASIDGLLVGYQDAYTYAVMFGLAPAPAVTLTTPPPITTVAPEATPEATEAASEEATELPLVQQLETLDAMGTATGEARAAEATEAAGEAPAVVPTQRPTRTPASTRTPVPPTATPQPTDTPPPTSTTAPTSTGAPTTTPSPSDTPTATATSSLTPTRAPSATPTEAPLVIGVIASVQTVNVRSGPGTTYDIIANVPSRGQVEITGENSAGTWYQVRLFDEERTEGWISATLIRILEPDEITPTAESAALQKPYIMARIPPAQAEATEEGTPPLQDAAQEVTAEAVVTPTPAHTPRSETAARVRATATPVVAVGVVTLNPEYRDERWYAMTLGIVVSASIISLGALINILRGLFGRRGR